MGMLGFDLYQNDMTLDIKDEFEKLLSTGKHRKKLLMKYWQSTEA